MDYLYKLLEILNLKKTNCEDNNFKKPSGYKNINTNSIRL